MLTFAPNLRIYLHARPTDMRKSFDGLCALVRSVFQADPLDGSLFLFVNRRGDRHQDDVVGPRRPGSILQAFGIGDVSRCSAPEGEAATVEIDATELAMLLSGVSLASAKRRKRYSRAG